MTAGHVLTALRAGQSVSGRHVVVTAHPDDESISFGGALCCLTDATIVQMTDGVPPSQGDRLATVVARELERMTAFLAAGWSWPVLTCGYGGRTAYLHLQALVEVVGASLVDADVVWTHPYEGGHIDHEVASWVVQEACGRMAQPPIRMEFASYNANGFGQFWPPEPVQPLKAEQLARKQAAIAAYSSQAHILRKFPRLDLEPYRIAPVYDFFMQPAPVPISRWDARGYQPRMATFRAAVAAVRQVPA